MVDDDDDVKNPKAKGGRGSDEGLAWLQRRFLLVLQGVLFVYELDAFNSRIQAAKAAGESSAKVTTLTDELNNNTNIRTYVADKVQTKFRTNQKLIAAPKEKKEAKAKATDPKAKEVEVTHQGIVMKLSE